MSDESEEQQASEQPQSKEGDSGKTSPEEEREQAKEEVRQLEEEPPEDLEDWPKGAAKYETFGGPEGTHSYHEGPEQKLGPSSLRHHEGGEVEIEGEMVDDPDKYKSDPVPGGPTDPDAPKDMVEESKHGSGEGDEDGGGERQEQDES